MKKNTVGRNIDGNKKKIRILGVEAQIGNFYLVKVMFFNIRLLLDNKGGMYIPEDSMRLFHLFSLWTQLYCLVSRKFD